MCRELSEWVMVVCLNGHVLNRLPCRTRWSSAGMRVAVQFVNREGEYWTPFDTFAGWCDVLRKNYGDECVIAITCQ